MGEHGGRDGELFAAKCPTRLRSSSAARFSRATVYSGSCLVDGWLVKVSDCEGGVSPSPWWARRLAWADWAAADMVDSEMVRRMPPLGLLPTDPRRGEPPTSSVLFLRLSGAPSSLWRRSEPLFERCELLRRGADAPFSPSSSLRGWNEHAVNDEWGVHMDSRHLKHVPAGRYATLAGAGAWPAPNRWLALARRMRPGKIQQTVNANRLQMPK